MPEREQGRVDQSDPTLPPVEYFPLSPELLRGGSGGGDHRSESIESVRDGSLDVGSNVVNHPSVRNPDGMTDVGELGVAAEWRRLDDAGNGVVLLTDGGRIDSEMLVHLYRSRLARVTDYFDDDRQGNRRDSFETVLQEALDSSPDMLEKGTRRFAIADTWTDTDTGETRAQVAVANGGVALKVNHMTSEITEVATSEKPPSFQDKALDVLKDETRLFSLISGYDMMEGAQQRRLERKLVEIFTTHQESILNLNHEIGQINTIDESEFKGLFMDLERMPSDGWTVVREALETFDEEMNAHETMLSQPDVEIAETSLQPGEDLILLSGIDAEAVMQQKRTDVVGSTLAPTAAEAARVVVRNQTQDDQSGLPQPCVVIRNEVSDAVIAHDMRRGFWEGDNADDARATSDPPIPLPSRPAGLGERIPTLPWPPAADAAADPPPLVPPVVRGAVDTPPPPPIVPAVEAGGEVTLEQRLVEIDNILDADPHMSKIRDLMRSADNLDTRAASTRSKAIEGMAIAVRARITRDYDADMVTEVERLVNEIADIRVILNNQVHII